MEAAKSEAVQGGPEVPPAAGAAEAAPAGPVYQEIPWNKRFCPVLSSGWMQATRQEPSRLLAPGMAPTPQKGPELFACQGGSCMFFVPTIDEKTHQIVNGQCAIGQIPMMLAAGAQASATLLEILSRRAKLKGM